MDTSPAIESFGLSRRFGRRLAVDGLSLRVPRGRLFGLIGPEGAGKTTALRMLAGLLAPSAGRACLLGHDLGREGAAVRARVGAVFAAPAFYAYLSGRDNLRLLARMAGAAPGGIPAALAAVGLLERAGERLRGYGPGERWRLALAGALLGAPEILLLDEPAGGLGAPEAEVVRRLARSLGGAGRTVVLAGRPRSAIEQIADELALIGWGRLLAQGPPAALLGGGLLVEAEPLPVLRAVAGRLGLSARPAGPRSLILALDPAEAGRLEAALASAGVRVFQLAPRRLTVEDHFREAAP